MKIETVFLKAFLSKGSISKCFSQQTYCRLSQRHLLGSPVSDLSDRCISDLSSLCVFPSTKPPFLALLFAGTADLLQLSIGSGSQKILQRSEMGGKETGVSAYTPHRASSRYQCVLGTHFPPSSAQGQKVCQSVGSQHLLMSSDPANTCLVKSFHFT